MSLTLLLLTINKSKLPIMAKKYIAFLYSLFLTLLLLSNGFLHASETDSLFQQKPEIFASQNNLYISNTEFYISKNTDIILTGDLTLVNTDVIGQGSLILKSDQNRTIKSTNSSISHLEIRNPKTVALIGELSIKQSLVVNGGIFDISKGNLHADPDSIIFLNKGSLFTGHGAQFKSASETNLTAEANSSMGNSQSITAIETKAILGYSEKTPLFFKESLHSNTIQSLLLHPPS